MTTTLREGYIIGSGAVLDVTTSVTVADTRIRSVYATGVGTFLITGTSTNPYGTIQGNNIKFAMTTASDASEIFFTDLGIKMNGTVKVSAPTVGSTVAIFYG
jgi:hypothetical protein|tara:strand:+ start:10386 stop:10691 length:306 start_codon:yes stop_codon:yes gene_type:complete